MDLFALATVPAEPDEAGGPPPTKFYRRRDNVQFKPAPTYGDFLNLTEVLSVLGTLRCSMYDNALIPVALANKLVSLSEFPSSRILETFAKDAIR